MTFEIATAIVKEMAKVYTVDTDQHALITLVHRAQQALTPPASIVREDKDLIDFTEQQIAELMATLLFAKRLSWISPQQKAELVEACAEFVRQQIDEHVPVEPTEPCAMSAAKYEAES